MLQGKKAVITGASRGVGRAIALAYAAQHCDLILVARDETRLNEVANECKQQRAGNVEVHAVDMGCSKSVQSFAEAVVKKHGSIDVLVNNAGIADRGNALVGDPDAWEKMFAVNVHGPMRLTRCFAPGMVEKHSGVIINVCSIAGIEGMKEVGAYSATKFALRGWSLSCYEKLRQNNIKVMAIHPGFISTDMVRGVATELKYDMSKAITPEDVAEVALLPFRTSAACCPQEVTIRLTVPAFSPNESF